MEAARDLFVNKGYQHVSMRQIAKVLNYSHGAIYYHFKNKAELFYALVEEHFSMLDDILERIMKKNVDPQEKLELIMLGFIEFGLNHQSHYEIMFLIKDEEVRNFVNQGPNKSYEKFAQSLLTLSQKQISIQEIWSIFLSLHGFVVHYSRHVITYEEVKGMALVHVKILLRNLI
jgi:AcrR family transcriptional regulator